MKRRRLAALLGACLVSALLALAPASASAWLADQPRLEEQMVIEGDPEGPDWALPGLERLAVTEGDPIDPGLACRETDILSDLIAEMLALLVMP